jgi:sirohydrochlorin ferrochelatase
MTAPALVALAHGSRDPRSARTVRALVSEVHAMRPDLPIETAFLDLSRPDFHTVVDRLVRSGVEEIVVVPLLLTEAFHARHRALFTYALQGEEVVLVNARLAVIGRLPPMPAAAATTAAVPAAPFATRRARLSGAEQALPVFDFAALAAGQVVQGPAIVESDTTTVLLLPGDAARMDARGWLDIALPKEA